MPQVQADLRLATVEVHERLHEAEPFGRIARAELGMADYRKLLRAILRFHASVRPILAACPETAALGGGLDRIDRLQSDLSHTGPECTLPCQAHLPLEADEVLGCLYVVQGSALGGRVIYRQLDYLFEGAEGRSFFLGSGEDGARWQQVRALLENQPPDRQAALRRGAARTFGLFEECLAGERLNNSCPIR